MATYKEYKKGTYNESDRLKDLNSQSDYWSKQQLQNFEWDDSKLSADTKNWQNKLNSLQAPTWNGFSKQSDWDNVLNQITNMKDFSYDVNGDALYQQYKDQYTTQGKMAMMDTMGQAAALTGGYGNSYAQSVGQQTYQGYLQQLTDKVPELYQLALSKYNSDKDNLYRQNDLYQNLFNNEYGMHRDAVSDYNSDRNFYANRYDTGYSRDFDAALAENESYNSNLDSNRTYYNNAANALANLEWGKYTDNETLAQKAIDIYNENAYRQNQLDFEALENQYEGYMSPEDVAEYQKAANSDQTKAFMASIPSNEKGREWARFSNGDGTYTYDGKRYDSKKSVIASIIDSWEKDGKLTPGEEAWLKGYYDVDVD